MQDRGSDSPHRGTLQTHGVEADPDTDADAEIGEEDDHEVALIDLIDTLENAQSRLAARGRRSDDLNEFASEHFPGGEKEEGEKQPRSKLSQRDHDASRADEQHRTDIDRRRRCKRCLRLVGGWRGRIRELLQLSGGALYMLQCAAVVNPCIRDCNAQSLHRVRQLLKDIAGIVADAPDRPRNERNHDQDHEQSGEPARNAPRRESTYRGRERITQRQAQQQRDEERRCTSQQKEREHDRDQRQRNGAGIGRQLRSESFARRAGGSGARCSCIAFR